MSGSEELNRMVLPVRAEHLFFCIFNVLLSLVRCIIMFLVSKTAFGALV
jgi:hypothetical protein